MGRLRHRLLAVSLAALALLAAVVPVSASPGLDPVLLVHGWRGDPATWADMRAMFEAAQPGRRVHAIDLATEDNVANANQIRTYIASQGWTRVDIVGQSMGGLSARHFIKVLTPQTTVVDTYVTLGTPQYGLWSACLLPVKGGGQMCPSSSFLRTLNSGDDTPDTNGSPKVLWTTIYSTDDGLVPTSASRLDGGACHVQVSGVTHNEMDNSPTVFGHVLAAVDRQTCTGSFR